LVYLRKIETRGFKSMGTKPVTVQLENGLVAITGPNGSGKSNLLDAVLFALGENSAKTLRAPNLTSLIYDGSVEEQKPSSAKVSLQFDNTDRRIPTDSDSVTITRELKINGESSYFLNGKHIQRNNLSELLEMALITSRGLNVVLQGMVTRLSELVPDEKRKLIESMVGISQFDEKKQEALAQLREADVKLEVAMAKIGEIRDRIQLLEQQRNDQLRLKQLEDQISWLRAASASTKLARVRQLITERNDSSSQSSFRLQDVQNHLAAVTKSMEAVDSERSLLIQSAMETGTAKIEAELGKVGNELKVLKDERQQATDYLDKMRQVAPYMSRMTNEQSAKIAEAESQVGTIRAKLKSVEERKNECTLLHAKLNEERNAFEAEFSAAQDQNNEIHREKEEQDKKLQEARDHSNELNSELRVREGRLESIRERLEFYGKNLEDAQKSIEELASVLSSQKGELDGISQSRARLEGLRKRVDSQLDIAALIFEKAQTAVTKYDSDLSALETVAGDEVALAKLQNSTQPGSLPGYIGPLHLLISYDDRYSQAIAAIGQDWLNALVVENIESLVKIAETAKSLKISKLTAIPLSEISEFESPKHIPIKGLIAYVTDILSCEPRIKRIVNFVFGDALIVDSPRNAFIAARRGFRAVTIRGDVFEPDVLAFEMGYSKRYAKIAEILGKQESFEGVRRTLDAFRAVIEKRKSSLARLAEKTDSYLADEQARSVSISKIEARLESARQFLEGYLSSQKTLKRNENDAEEEIKKIRVLFEEAQAQVSQLAASSENLSKKLSSMDVNAFQSRASEINKRKMELDSRIESINSEVMDLMMDHTRVKADLENNLRPSLERLTKEQTEIESTVATKTKFLQDTEQGLGELESQFAALKEQEAKSLEKANKFQPMLAALDARQKALKTEEDSIRKSVSALEKELVAANLDIDRLKDSERSLLGELAIYGYAEPVDAFEGADTLLKELNVEFDELRNQVNLLADKNYREIFENYKYSSVRKNDLEKERNAIVVFIETIDSEKHRVFMDAFERIDRELRVIFTKITNGAAWLEIENPDAVFDSGIFLMTQFPGKLPRDSSAVSGGEKTISALSFILAIQAVFPSPFYVFDEVDAHLDSNYSGKLGEILAERSSFSQIIIVSLKDVMVSKAGTVIGVYQSQGFSHVLRYRSGMEVQVPTE
jgi:chromosome segregation protein